MSTMQPQPSSATLVGYTRVFFWSFSALYNSFVRSIPTFEIVMIAYTIASLIIFTKVAYKGEWYLFKQPLLVYIIGILGLFVNDVFYTAAFKRIPPVQADLINYLWPVVVVVCAGTFTKDKFNIYHLIATIIALLGVYILLSAGHGIGNFHASLWLGYMFSLAGVAVWCIYVLYTRYRAKIPVEMVAMYCAIGVILSIFPHFYWEKTVIPSARQWLILIMLGCTSQGLAYVFWQYGIKHGNIILLSILSYGNPVISVILLVIFSFAHLSDVVITATLFITIAGLLARFDKAMHQFLCLRFCR